MKSIIIYALISLGLLSPSIEAIPPEVNTDGLCTYEIVVQPEAEAAEDVQQRFFACIPLDAELQEKMFCLCDELGLAPELALGLMQTESEFDVNALNGSGCYGLCQLNPVYFPSGLTPAENMDYGLRYLAHNIEIYGDTAAALCAYNAGHDTGARGYANLVLARASEWEDKL